MVKSNTLDSMLEVLNSSHILKSWSIYNDRYTGDVVVRVRFMQSAECGEAGSVDHGTFKRKTPHQAARDQTRADHYKQTRNAKLNNANNTHTLILKQRQILEKHHYGITP